MMIYAEIKGQMVNSVLDTMRTWFILGSSTGQLDMRVWNFGVTPGLEIEIHMSLMFRKPLQ